MKASVLKDMPVVSMADGARVGTVQDVLFATNPLGVTSLVLSGQGGKAALPFSDVRSIGNDAVTVDNREAIHGFQAPGAPENLRSLRDMTRLKVVNAEGTYLGDVQEVEIDQKTGQVGEFIAHRGGMLGLGGTTIHVPATAIRGIGPKLLTVDMPAQDGSGGAPPRAS